MGRFIYFLLAFLVPSEISYLAHGQSQQGFISIDCGSSYGYTEPITGLNYVSDSEFVDTGTAWSIPSNDISTTLQKQFWNLRNFPQGTRNCFNVKVNIGTKYLIRASFLYANYDNQNSIPKFDLHFGPNFWTTVDLGSDVQNIIHDEIVHITTSDHVQVCLINTGNGIPFISALELRPLASASYETVSGALATFLRLDIGAENDTFTRYPDDIYDRIWSPALPILGWTTISTPSSVSNQGDNYITPSVVLRTASTVINASLPMQFSWMDPLLSSQFYIYMYFAELKELQANQSRLFKIYLNDKILLSDHSVILNYLRVTVVDSLFPLVISGSYQFKLVMSEGSTLPPILNAIEIFTVINITESTTALDDANALDSLKKIYGVTKDWQGDPCLPKKYAWQGLSCSYDGSNPPRIIGLNLSSSGLTGGITANILNLVKLEVLDLSNNRLNGTVPDFLARMPLLRVLNLSRNNLSGQIPSLLLEEMNRDSLSFTFEGNPNLLGPATTPSEKKNNKVIPAVAAVGGVIIILLMILASVFFIRRRRSPEDPVRMEPYSPQKSHYELHPPLESPSRQYSYSDILSITNNFSRLLGEGGFGKVYYGRIGNTEVAVKMLSPKSAQGYQEFKTEVDLLFRVHHRNLTSLIGYCNEGETKMGLVYEYMSRGELGALLLGGEGDVLRWQDRLQTALDSAQGLEYLHNGCRPPIIHRDIKSSNILLNEHLEAKLADFGLSRAFPNARDATHVTTKIVGTPGYLDPEYYSSYRLTEKSDVYSFGIVILELITGRPALSKTSEISHIIRWVDSNINKGDIYSVIDSRIKDDCEINSVSKAVDIGMSCTNHDSAKRPTMSQVVNDLKECLNLELNKREACRVDSTTTISSEFNSGVDSIAISFN